MEPAAEVLLTVSPLVEPDPHGAASEAVVAEQHAQQRR
jgi:hypothetical protein